MNLGPFPKLEKLLDHTLSKIQLQQSDIHSTWGRLLQQTNTVAIYFQQTAKRVNIGYSNTTNPSAIETSFFSIYLFIFLSFRS